MPPCTLLGGSKRWGERDRLAAIALTLYEASLCKGCSQDVASWGANPALTVQAPVCPGCAALEKFQADNPKLPAGSKPYVVPDVVDVADLDGDEELPPWLL